jgi:lantibiotic leader peptide-processing serine protease
MKVVRVGSWISLVGLVLAGCVERSAPTVPAAELEATHSVSGSVVGQHIVVLRGNGARALENRVHALGGRVTFLHERVGIAIVEGLSASAATQLSRANGVAEVHADVPMSLVRPEEVSALEVALDGAQSQTDPASAILASWQWNMQAIDAPTAWSAGKLGSPNVTVAIVDTGLDYQSFDLAGLVDLSRSRSFVPEDDAIVAALLPGWHPISDLNGHGTNVGLQVSSTAFAFAGVTSMTTLTGIKVLDRNGSGFLSRTLAGVLHAVDTDADVVNLSLGGAFEKRGLGQLVSIVNRVFNYAHQRGVLIVVAAGNAGANLDRDGVIYDTYCDAPHVICVSAVGPTTGTGSPDIPAFYTNFGRSAISVAAPGGNSAFVFSAWPWGVDFVSWVWSLCSRTTIDLSGDGPTFPFISGGWICGAIGTSQAAPHVSGLAALLIAEGGKNRPAQIRSAIERSADRVGSRGNDPFTGRGRINVAAALGL